MSIDPNAQPVPRLDTSYPDSEGIERSIAGSLACGPVLLGIYKSSCQASKAMFPMLERLHERYSGNGLTTLGVSQDSPNVTRSFARRYGVTFPILIEGDAFPLSRGFGIYATPSIFVIDADGTVSYTTMGFLRDQVNEIGAAIAGQLGIAPGSIVSDADAEVPLFVPG